MQRILKYCVPQNAHIVDTIRFVPNFRQLRVSWTAFSPICEGVEQFVDEYLPIIRNNNPQVDFMLKRCHVEVDPWLVGIYDFERKRAHRLNWKHSSQILAMVEEFSIGGDYRPGRRRRVNTILPRGLQLWNVESKGHDVYKIHSKWKADPPDPEAPTSMTHPNLCYRRGPMFRKRKKGSA